jgi:hypothetical protein
MTAPLDIANESNCEPQPVQPGAIAGIVSLLVQDLPYWLGTYSLSGGK